MASEMNEESNQARIRDLIDEWATAFRAKDIDGLTANHSPDIVLFDVPAPLQHRGAEAYRKNWERWLPTLEAPVGCEIQELSVTAGDDVAFSHCLNRITSKRADGEPTSAWVRVTIGFRKIEGAWTVTHEHVSMPLDMDSANGACDREP